MIIRSLLLFILFSISVLSIHAQDKEISATELKKIISFLASDSLKGRYPGTPGDKAAAAYIAKQFQDKGLKLIFENGFQSIDIISGVTEGKNNRFVTSDFTGKPNVDFIPLSFSSNATVSAPVVFAGYGIDINTDSLKRNDYSGVDIKEKWVMLFRGDPDADNPDSPFSMYAQNRTKVLAAADKGAAGVILVSPSDQWKKDNLIPMKFDNSNNACNIPVINITRKTADKILKSSGTTILELETKSGTGKQTAFYIQDTVEATTDLIYNKNTTQNIAALLEGNDPVLKDQFIIIGAHYDHLGMGGGNSRTPDTIAVHYGADDNASGVAGIIELAGKLASFKDRKRSIIVVAFAAEELGMYGSKKFISEPPVNKHAITAMFNFDMIGRFDKDKNRISVSGSGTSTESDTLLKMYAAKLPFTVTLNPEGYSPSDNASFYKENIPVFFFTTGIHLDYHTPFDVVEKIDFKGEKALLDYAYNVIADIDTSKNPLVFRESGSQNESSARGGFKVTLGIIPDVTSSDGKGLPVDGVRKDGPADKAGIKKGDVITSMNGESVGNVYDYMSRLGKLKKGQKVEIEILRNGIKEKIQVQL